MNLGKEKVLLFVIMCYNILPSHKMFQMKDRLKKKKTKNEMKGEGNLPWVSACYLGGVTESFSILA